ncbi:MAG: ABC transporter ATP-binding protein [Akkermansiaceae bacterium]|nr:ABC transporter ATP-binding protein [Akkermansiaceae bacterium]NNM27917.1 ABC transporter ATP-binding protein [Akkermansiaceae bacterium]
MIEAQGISRVYETPGESLRVLDGLDLSVADGATVAVVGPSGSGKTTLLNLLGALDRPTSGSIVIGGRDVTGLREEEASAFRNRELGFIFQQHYLLPQLSVLENVLVPRLAGGWDEDAARTEDRARMLLERVGLEGRLGHHPHQLSGGEKLRTAVARALVNEPQLVLADEPTGSLDVETTERVADLLLELNAERGVTLVVVTHNAELAGKMGAVFELRRGKLAERKG